ncbi:Uncharacterised protein [Legionella busanensis]|uniref:Uncharacterized protein n=1 Tax=Legionella busanensis TaxID=190655 RepID=A0A378JPF6_9GAMM|nr:hypothetical protein [Legionella busanensis]STX52601.1 Uncharacterised protein [Legionella busanensis]
MKILLKISRENVLFLLVAIVLTGAPLFLFIDSPLVASFFNYGQDTCNLIMFITYSLFLLFAKKKLYWLILLMTICSLGAEIIGSLLLTLYEYRLNNIPLYIPMAHAVLYATVYCLCNHEIVKSKRLILEEFFTRFAFLTSCLSLFILTDIAGFICYLLFLFILCFRKNQLFYLVMFAMVYYIELLGTVFSTWSWYGVTGKHPYYPPIGYTPSGMAGLYILIDLLSNSIYFYHLKLLRFIYRITPQLKLKTHT